jgi:ribosomal protein RSM22 (predicted rRNA methylase)
MTFERLFEQIERLLSKVPVSELKKAAVCVSERYRRLEEASDFRLYHEIERLAYLAMRMPATVAVLDKILKEIPTTEPMSLLDVGCGPGSALWAAGSLPLTHVVCLEHEKGWIDIAKELWKSCESVNGVGVEWKVADLSTAKLPESELVIASYCLNELEEEKLEKAIDRLLEASLKYFVWVEPGTSESFGRMKKIRQKVLKEKKAHILAPCLGNFTCPYMTREADSKTFTLGPGWCHFSARLQRPAFHRLIKDVKMSYEDEKYCYLIFEKREASPHSSSSLRLMEDPMSRKGHVRLVGCNPNCQIEEQVVTKSHENYKQARKTSWGHLWPEP